MGWDLENTKTYQEKTLTLIVSFHSLHGVTRLCDFRTEYIFDQDSWIPVEITDDNHILAIYHFAEILVDTSTVPACKIVSSNWKV